MHTPVCLKHKHTVVFVSVIYLYTVKSTGSPRLVYEKQQSLGSSPLSPFLVNHF